MEVFSETDVYFVEKSSDIKIPDIYYYFVIRIAKRCLLCICNSLLIFCYSVLWSQKTFGLGSTSEITLSSQTETRVNTFTANSLEIEVIFCLWFWNCVNCFGNELSNSYNKIFRSISLRLCLASDLILCWALIEDNKLCDNWLIRLWIAMIFQLWLKFDFLVKQ